MAASRRDLGGGKGKSGMGRPGWHRGGGLKCLWSFRCQPWTWICGLSGWLGGGAQGGRACHSRQERGRLATVKWVRRVGLPPAAWRARLPSQAGGADQSLRLDGQKYAADDQTHPAYVNIRYLCRSIYAWPAYSVVPMLRACDETASRPLGV
jgi:hypothetical protein